MKRIKDIENFEMNESLISRFITVEPKDIEAVKKATPDDLGDEDTATRKSILDTAFSLYSHFDKEKDKSKFIQKVLSLDQDGREKVLNSAKAYAQSLSKIRKIEIDDVEPIQAGLDSIINENK